MAEDSATLGSRISGAGTARVVSSTAFVGSRLELGPPMADADVSAAAPLFSASF